jgi:hypothetical protein
MSLFLHDAESNVVMPVSSWRGSPVIQSGIEPMIYEDSTSLGDKRNLLELFPTKSNGVQAMQQVGNARAKNAAGIADGLYLTRSSFFS